MHSTYYITLLMLLLFVRCCHLLIPIHFISMWKIYEFKEKDVFFFFASHVFLITKIFAFLSIYFCSVAVATLGDARPAEESTLDISTVWPLAQPSREDQIGSVLLLALAVICTKYSIYENGFHLNQIDLRVVLYRVFYRVASKYMAGGWKFGTCFW